MRVRMMGPADALLYRALRLRALREHPDAFTSSYEEDRGQPVEAAAQRLRAHPFWGAYRLAELYGFVGMERELRPKNRHKATVMGMYVAPEAGGQGVARALLDALIAHARLNGIESLVLTVTDGNQRAQRLYEAAGFRSFGVEPDAIRIGGRSCAKNHMHLNLGPQAS
ncbi:MAG: GCN5-related N-acetyltransferase [Ramlibacter sp.]|jgi:ribosomal protein S18 acetylase RimI-like enzyme|nr:GCN5-related N-acetyltransferase [Ramlibacter sp.]MDB5911935.1 GCN5-related N-acetyltransferase [Ramlibacter sp.]